MSNQAASGATPVYADRYENLALTRDATACSCSASTPRAARWVHRPDPPGLAALEEISLDRENEALVITGTGDSVMDQIDGPSLGEIFKPAAWEKTRVEGAKVLQRLLGAADPGGRGGKRACDRALRVSARRGHPHRVGASKLWRLPHPAFGHTAGDGLPVVWKGVAGTARAKWLLWTGESIDAQIALQWGVVSEVVAHDRALDRGIEIARSLAAKPAL